MFGTAQPHNRINPIVKAISDYSIRIPSNLRLLRLVNGRNCERWEKCFAFKTERQRSPAVAGDFLQGMNLCNVCIAHLTQNCYCKFSVTGGNVRTYQLHPEGLSTGFRPLNSSISLFLVPEVQVEAATGEKVGTFGDAVAYRQARIYHGESSSFQVEPVSEEYERLRATILSCYDVATSQYPKFRKERLDLNQRR